MKRDRPRLDVLCVARGIAESRERAQALILAGQVLVDGQVQSKAGTRLREDVRLELRGKPMPYVSRGGLKLNAALEHFGVAGEALEIADRVALDVGASTGGFTDCLLQRGARHVIAVDVGYGQLAWKLRQDPRVTNIERTNARSLTIAALRELAPDDVWPPVLAVIDVSFISLTLVLPAVCEILGAGRPIVCLIKPQFEARREHIGKGGVVRDPQYRQAAIDNVLSWARAADYTVVGSVDSSVPGPKGNVEHLAHLLTPASSGRCP